MFEVGVEREEGDFMKNYRYSDSLYAIIVCLLEEMDKEGKDWSAEIEELRAAMAVFDGKERVIETKKKILDFYDRICPDSSREKSLAITKLEESFLWLEQAMNK